MPVGSVSVEEIEVVVGRIGKPHGLRGEVTVEVRTDEPERRFATGATLRAEAPSSTARQETQRQDSRSSLSVASTRWHQSVLLVRFEGVESRADAEALRDTMVHVTVPADLSPDDPDEYYEYQLVGLTVVDTDGSPIGEVTALQPGAAQDLLGIRALDGRDVLVPFVSQLVPEVDLTGGRVMVADRPGLVAPFVDA